LASEAVTRGKVAGAGGAGGPAQAAVRQR